MAQELADSMETSRSKTVPFLFKLSTNEKRFWKATVIVSLAALLYLVEQFCSSILPIAWKIVVLDVFPLSTCATYISIGIILASLVLDRFLRHKNVVHQARLEDDSEVHALLAEAESIQPRMTQSTEDAEFQKNRIDLEREVKKLKELGEWEWVEYKVLHLNLLLVEFLDHEDLKVRIQLMYDDLEEEYLEIEADKSWFEGIKGEIKEAVNALTPHKKLPEGKIEERLERLRALLRKLFEYKVDYDYKWSEGTATIKGLMTAGVIAVPLLLFMGLLPVIHPSGSGELSILNWGFLGISGAITQVLSVLRKSRAVTVGERKGKEELWRAILAAVLGLVAGVLLYAMILGGIISGDAFPNLDLSDDGKSKFQTLGRSIFWAITAGFSFEWVFEKLRKTGSET